MLESMNYEQSGVNREKADLLVDKILRLTRSTQNSKVKSSIGGYASLFALDSKRWLAATTDGVGTKLKLGFELDEHKTIGIDLVAMSVNDLLCVGAEPLFFLDYLATSHLDSRRAYEVLQGIVEGCKQAGCALVGGETAEMPGLYSQGEYDLAGFAVGLVDKKDVLPQKNIRFGDILVGVRSSGFHSNGFSLLRKILEKLQEKGENVQSLKKMLLTPTRIYCQDILPLLGTQAVKGIAHITGSGFLNVPRMSSQVSYRIELPPGSERPEVFQWLRSLELVDFKEQVQTFNMGIGLVLAVAPSKADSVLKKLNKKNNQAWIIGEVIRSSNGSQVEVIDSESGQKAILK